MEVEIFQWLHCTDDFQGFFFGNHPNNNVIDEAEDLLLADEIFKFWTDKRALWK